MKTLGRAGDRADVLWGTDGIGKASAERGSVAKSLVERVHSEGRSVWSLGGCGGGSDEAAVSRDQLQW